MKTAKEFIKENYTLTNGGEDYICNHSGQLVGTEDIAEEYASQPKWISVEDCIPPLNQKVLGATDNGYIDLGYWNEEVGDIESGTSFFMHASYWQPLPTPPTE